ncbi:MAG: hypothetical protein KDB23_32760, partial [Planctomycetales bacterium]|nr:hypothetical protein [Planctomycetales bacterium]
MAIGSNRLVLPLILIALTVTTTYGQRRGSSPDVQDDGRVTFRIDAANAKTVELAGQWPEGRVALERDGEQGPWQVTVGPVPKGVWEYSLVVDGLSMIDPNNPAIKPMRSPRTSILHLPSSPPAAYDFREVPHGTVRLHTYHSKSLDRLRDLAVYTPPGYDEQTEVRYPTLYLQHGSGDNQATWTVHGKAHWIADNLLADSRAQPMVIVMMDGHAALPNEGRGANTERFEQDLMQDVMPFVESTYRVSKESTQRAIVGLSMGGGQSLTIGLNHTDVFAWVGGFSSSVPTADGIASAINNVDATNSNLKLLWIACGKDDFLLERNNQFIELLNEKNVKHTWVLTEGNHSWPIWRDYLTQFLPL